MRLRVLVCTALLGLGAGCGGYDNGYAIGLVMQLLDGALRPEMRKITIDVSGDTEPSMFTFSVGPASFMNGEERTIYRPATNLASAILFFQLSVLNASGSMIGGAAAQAQPNIGKTKLVNLL